jgi:hypothetical protein
VRFVAIHHNAEQRHIGRRWRRRWGLRRDDDRWGRRRRPARGGEQRTLARRRQAIERLRRQRTWECVPLPTQRGRLTRLVRKSGWIGCSLNERAGRPRSQWRRRWRRLRRRIGRHNGGWRERQQRRDGYGPKQGHAVPRRQ